jgi:hemolysin III
MHHPVRGILHGSAAVLSVAGLVAMVNTGASSHRLWALVVYGVALVALYTTSALYHAIPWRPVWKARFQRLDHTVIYVLVAGTFTPLAVALLDGRWVWYGLSSVWGLAAVGAAREFWVQFRTRGSLALQVVLVALGLVTLFEMFGRMDPLTVSLTVSGGVIYIGGMLMMVNGWPRLVPRVFSYHEFFHVLVILASAVHFLAIRQVTLASV